MDTQDRKPFKFGSMSDRNELLEHRYGGVWDVEKTTGPPRIVVAPASAQIAMVGDLMRELPEPFGLLYVLVVSRMGQQAARYQSPDPTDRSETLAFLKEYREYLESDGRHHLWVMSLPASSTIVYDNHNVIFAYGPLDKFQHALEVKGLARGEVRFPVPHVHQYNSEYDAAEVKILRHWAWKPFPLQEQDE